jgi:hypothetical protein
MSHQEEIERMNAELNTSDTWARRWQVEREHNERLLKQASLARQGLHNMKAETSSSYAKHGTWAAAARAAGDERALRNHERMLIIQSARTAALDDFLQLFDQIEHIE